ncbi:hypothetical protein QL285_033880 [Trifolium repens]|nr:hypothetical protein QL285_033880 [Trifolium repens]
MAASEVCPVVDAINAFLEYLVDPLLQEEHYVSDDPPLSLQEKVAKQVHSVVLLYNYYYRKQNPGLEFMRYREFCKMIVDLRPILVPYMKFTLKPDYDVELIDVEQQLSLTENEIMNSYHICTDLDASKTVPNIKGWPISKVAILLVDSKKENCFLCFSSITDGVWSLIEKQVDTNNQISEVKSEILFQSEKRRVIKKRSKDGLNEDQILQVGFSAVKEVAGVNATDTILLESYNVYSHTKDRTTSQFYLMKCSKLINEGLILLPIKDLIQREIFSDSLHDSKLIEKQFSKLELGKSHVSSEGMHVALDNNTIVPLNQEEWNYGGNGASSQSHGAPMALKVYSRRKYKKRGIGSTVREGNYGGDVVSSHSHGAPNALKVYSRRNKKKDR